ncbi:MAG: glycosyltransferase family 4 protein [Tissierellia bacterium]|nr:glycosyltransferase family 4 protein [Tissierellia bacterium]
MRILHVLTQLPAKTGSGVYFTNLIESFNKMNIENGAIYGTEEGMDINVDADYIKEVIYNTKKIPFHICGMSDTMPYSSTVYSQMKDYEIDMLLAEFKEKLEQAKKEFDPDIVISHHLFIVTDLVRRVFNDRAVVAISHGTDLRQVLKHNKFLERLENIKDLDKVLTVTPLEHKNIENILKVDKNKIYLVGGGYNEKIFYPEDLRNRDKIRVMYAGKISRSKGVFELAKTLPLLEEKHKNLELHIVGNADSNSAKILRQNSNYSDKLKLYDAENQPTMAIHLKASDIFVLPSYFEALGLTAIEALACNKLVVTSEIKGLREFLDNEILESGVIEFTKLPTIYDVDKPVEEETDDYVKRLVDNIEKQIERLDENLFTQNIQDKIKTYSWENLGYRIIRIIKE